MVIALSALRIEQAHAARLKTNIAGAHICAGHKKVHGWYLSLCVMRQADGFIGGNIVAGLSGLFCRFRGSALRDANCLCGVVGGTPTRSGVAETNKF